MPPRYNPYPKIRAIFAVLREVYGENWRRTGEVFALLIPGLLPDEVTSDAWVESLPAGFRHLGDDDTAVSCAVVRGWLCSMYTDMTDAIESHGGLDEFVMAVEEVVMKAVMAECDAASPE